MARQMVGGVIGCGLAGGFGCCGSLSSPGIPRSLRSRLFRRTKGAIVVWRRCRGEGGVGLVGTATTKIGRHGCVAGCARGVDFLLCSCGDD